MFLGHINDLKNDEFTVLKQCNNRNILTNNNGYKIVSNVCPHQQSLISIKDGEGSRVCPYHGWSFTVSGENIGSGTTSCKNKHKLESNNVFQWNSLLFSEPFNLDYDVDLSHMKLMEKRVDTLNCDYRNVMDLFLDVEHIPLIHKGVYETIGLSNIREVSWQYFDKGSLQIVERTDDSFNNHLIDIDRSKGAFWLAVYPNTMIEWQPGSLFVTIAIGDNKVAVYKYYDERYTMDSFNINSSVWEKAWDQDKSQCELLTQFTNNNLCAAKEHYRRFLNGGAL